MELQSGWGSNTGIVNPYTKSAEEHKKLSEEHQETKAKLDEAVSSLESLATMTYASLIKGLELAHDGGIIVATSEEEGHVIALFPEFRRSSNNHVGVSGHKVINMDGEVFTYINDVDYLSIRDLTPEEFNELSQGILGESIEKKEKEKIRAEEAVSLIGDVYDAFYSYTYDAMVDTTPEPEEVSDEEAERIWENADIDYTQERGKIVYNYQQAVMNITKEVARLETIRKDYEEELTELLKGSAGDGSNS